MPGKLIGAGKNADVYDIGGGRALRRYRDGRTASLVDNEAQVMRRARELGVPVPEVFDVSGADIVMECAVGPTMLQELGRRPWAAGAQARLLARLHQLVHQVPAAGLSGAALPRPFAAMPSPDSLVLLHRDLHPLNVILTGDGPVIIDWEGAACGPAIADIAMSWAIIGFATIAGDRRRAVTMRGVQVLFARSFLRAAGPLSDAWRTAAARHRLADRNVTPAEAARLQKLLRTLPPAARLTEGTGRSAPRCARPSAAASRARAGGSVAARSLP